MERERRKMVASKRKKMPNVKLMENKAKTARKTMTHMMKKMMTTAKERRAIKATTWLTSLSKLTMVS
jgi:hypothetical protein